MVGTTIVKVHPDGTGAQKNGPQAIDRSYGEWTTGIDSVGEDVRPAVVFPPSLGQVHDVPEVRKRSHRLGRGQGKSPLSADWAYEGDHTLQPVPELGFGVVFSPLGTLLHPWPYDRGVRTIRQVE